MLGKYIGAKTVQLWGGWVCSREMSRGHSLLTFMALPLQSTAAAHTQFMLNDSEHPKNSPVSYKLQNFSSAVHKYIPVDALWFFCRQVNVETVLSRWRFARIHVPNMSTANHPDGIVPDG